MPKEIRSRATRGVERSFFPIGLKRPWRDGASRRPKNRI